MRRKDRSLQVYLQKHVATNPREIRRLKREWRRRYQSQWQKEKRKSQNEIRFSVTKEEYLSIKSQSSNEQTTPTQWSKEIVIATAHQSRSIPDKQKLFEVLQKIGLAINRLMENQSSEVKPFLLEAEATLEDYLNSKS